MTNIYTFNEFVKVMEAFPAEPNFKKTDTDFNKILKTMYYMKQKQRGERRYTHEPSFKHPIGVYEYVNKYMLKPDLDIQMAALLHDIIEDTSEVTINKLQMLFNNQVAKYVQELTNDDVEIQRIGKAKYLINKINGMSNGAKIIKLCDRLHNLQDFKLADEKWVKRYGQQTFDILNELDESKLNHIHQTIIKDIRKTLKIHDAKIFN